MKLKAYSSIFPGPTALSGCLPDMESNLQDIGPAA